MIKLHISLLAPCCCRLLVQTEEDEGVLEFHASAGDLLRAAESEEVGLRNLQHEVLIPEGVQYFCPVMLSGCFSGCFCSVDACS